MSEYERLTNQKWSKDIDLTQELGYSYIYKRLYELENKIENGTLIELPCKVGDVVYFILDYVGFGKLEAEKTIRPKIVDYVDLYGFESDGLQVSWIDLNHQVFLSRVEAEKRLEEIKNEANTL